MSMLRNKSEGQIIYCKRFQPTKCALKAYPKISFAFTVFYKLYILYHKNPHSRDEVGHPMIVYRNGSLWKPIKLRVDRN